MGNSNSMVLRKSAPYRVHNTQGIHFSFPVSFASQSLAARRQEASAETKDVPVGRGGHPNSTARITDGLALLMERELRKQLARRRLENANVGSESSANFRSKSMAYSLKHFGLHLGHHPLRHLWVIESLSKRLRKDDLTDV
jgi:hypothetical protein